MYLFKLWWVFFCLNLPPVGESFINRHYNKVSKFNDILNQVAALAQNAVERFLSICLYTHMCTHIYLAAKAYKLISIHASVYNFQQFPQL